MESKVKDIIIVLEFFVLLFVVFIINIIKKDNYISITERRKLAQLPELTTSTVFSGEAASKFDKYAVDQFIERDTFKNIKSWFSMNVFGQKDSNKMFVKDKSIYKMEYPLNEAAIKWNANKMQMIYDKYLQGMNVYYSVIPDKCYYVNDDHLKMDYNKIENILNDNLSNMKYIDIKSSLDEKSFYKTDLHWRQEKIVNTAKILIKSMTNEDDTTSYQELEAGKFYGTYYGQVSSQVEADVIKYLSNNNIESSITYNYENNKTGSVYDFEKYSKSKDKYDIFVSGPAALITIDNPNSTENRELLLFRDSFGSSIAPLLLSKYKKITLIDLRYMNSSLLENYITFENQDVLFLYSGVSLNGRVIGDASF